MNTQSPTTTNLPESIPVTVSVPVWRLTGKDGQLAKVVDDTWSSVCRCHVRRAVLGAVRSIMIDHAGKRYQCSKRWAAEANAYIEQALGHMTMADDGAEAEWFNHVSVTIRRDRNYHLATDDIGVTCYWRAGGPGFSAYGDETVFLPSHIEESVNPGSVADHACGGEVVQGWPTNTEGHAKAECLGWAIIASANGCEPSCPGLETPRFPGPMGWEADPHPCPPDGKPIHQQDVALAMVDGSEPWLTPASRWRKEAMFASEQAQDLYHCMTEACRRHLNGSHTVDTVAADLWNHDGFDDQDIRAIFDEAMKNIGINS